jgi:hypothetical protein
MFPLRASVRSFSAGVALPKLPGEPTDDHAGKPGGSVERCSRKIAVDDAKLLATRACFVPEAVA